MIASAIIKKVAYYKLIVSGFVGFYLKPLRVINGSSQRHRFFTPKLILSLFISRFQEEPSAKLLVISRSTVQSRPTAPVPPQLSWQSITFVKWGSAVRSCEVAPNLTISYKSVTKKYILYIFKSVYNQCLRACKATLNFEIWLVEIVIIFPNVFRLPAKLFCVQNTRSVKCSER